MTRFAKGLLGFAIAYQLYVIVRAPNGEGMESLLAARELLHGNLPYRDFQMHVGFLPTLLFAGLFLIPPLAWYSLVFSIFNFLSAWAVWRLSRSLWPCILFLLIVPFFEGNAQYVETIMNTFGLWAFVFAKESRKGLALLMVLLAVCTKITGLVYLACLL